MSARGRRTVGGKEKGVLPACWCLSVSARQRIQSRMIPFNCVVQSCKYRWPQGGTRTRSLADNLSQSKKGVHTSSYIISSITNLLKHLGLRTQSRFYPSHSATHVLLPRRSIYPPHVPIAVHSDGFPSALCTTQTACSGAWSPIKNESRRR